jgi:hypothetical protein
MEENNKQNDKRHRNHIAKCRHKPNIINNALYIKCLYIPIKKWLAKEI